MALSAGVIPKRHATNTRVWEDSLIFSNSSGFEVRPNGTGAGNTGELRFLELAANGTNYTGFKAPDSLAGNVIYTLPSADGASGNFLSTNGSGTLSWGGSGTLTGLTLTPSAADYNTITVNHSDGNPRVQIGNIETSNTFGAIFLGNVTPSATNYILQSNGSSQTNLNGAGTLIIGSSNQDQIRMGLTETVINEGGADLDLRIEGQSYTHGFFYDASTGRVHVGYNTTPTGTETVNLAGTIGLTPSAANYDTVLVNHSNGARRVSLGNLESETGLGSAHFGAGTPAAGNYAIAGDSTNLRLNIATGGTMSFRENNTEISSLTASRFAFGVPAQAKSYTVAGLPTGAAGDIAYASNGRKNGEGVGSGTGVLVFSDGSNWIAVDTGATVAA